MGDAAGSEPAVAGKGLNRRGFLGLGAAGGGAVALAGLVHPASALAAPAASGQGAAVAQAPGRGYQMTPSSRRQSSQSCCPPPISAVSATPVAGAPTRSTGSSLLSRCPGRSTC